MENSKNNPKRFDRELTDEELIRVVQFTPSMFDRVPCNPEIEPVYEDVMNLGEDFYFACEKEIQEGKKDTLDKMNIRKNLLSKINQLQLFVINEILEENNHNRIKESRERKN